MNLTQKKVALVTGGSRGIGRSVCVRLAKDGYDVAVGYAGNSQAAAQTVAECEAAGVKAVAIKADVSLAADCEMLFARTIEEFGKVDVLVNNAGISKDALIMRASEEDYDRLMSVNLKSVFLCSKIVSKIMMKQRSGRIINMSSVVGLHGNVGQSMYAAAKAGIIGITKSVAKELSGRGITVNAIAPGFIETDMTDTLPDTVKEHMLAQIPLGRLGLPEEVADLTAFLASDAAAYITGQVISLDGGMSV